MPPWHCGGLVRLACTARLCYSQRLCPVAPHPQGSLVRAIRRLEELLRQLGEGLRGIGEVALAERFEAARERIKRDIIFAASLYL